MVLIIFNQNDTILKKDLCKDENSRAMNEVSPLDVNIIGSNLIRVGNLVAIFSSPSSYI